MPPVILGSAEWSTKQRMLSLFWNAAQPSIRTTMTVNYPWLARCGVFFAIYRRTDDHLCDHQWRWGKQVWLQPWRIHMVPVVNCSRLNGFRVNKWWCHDAMRVASLTVTPLSPPSPRGGTHFHIHHVFLCVSDGRTWGEKGMLAQITQSKFCEGKKVREKSGGAFTVGFLSINLSADYPGTEELNVMQIHL